MPSTPRLSIPYPTLADDADVPADLQALATAADAASFTLQGTFAARPGFGVTGRWYWATDQSVMYYDTGSAWVAINPAAAVDGPANTGTLRTLGTGPLQAAAGNDGRLSDQRIPVNESVTITKMAPSLKPSSGAGASSEALRALGTGPGQAAAGSHAAQHAAGGADPLAVTPTMLTAVPFGVSSKKGILVPGALVHNFDDWSSTNNMLASWFNASTPTRLMANGPYVGRYLINVAFAFQPHNVGSRDVRIRVNDIDVVIWGGPNNGSFGGVSGSVSWIQYFALTTKLEVILSHNAGQNVGIDSTVQLVRLGS